MGNDSSDPIDHSRTTRTHAGETMKNGLNAPGLLVFAIGIVAVVIALGAFASGHAEAGAVSAGVAVLGCAGGGAWLFLTHRHVRERELRWHADHATGQPQPPAS